MNTQAEPTWSIHEPPGLKGAWDFVGLNYYSRGVVAGSRGIMGLRQIPPPAGAETSTMGWEVYPEGFYQCITRLKHYGIPVYITENGIGTDDDEQRIQYVQSALEGVLRAIADGIDVRGYTYWSLLDNFEWAYGYRPRFGIVSVDRTTFERTPKPSAHWLGQIAKANAL